MSESFKSIATEVRLIIVIKLANLIVKVAPRTPEGIEWIAAIHRVTEQQLTKEFPSVRSQIQKPEDRS